VGTSGALRYVLPKGNIGDAGSDEVMYQPEWQSPTARTIKASGTLEDWKRHTAAKVCDHPWMLFALCVGFASVMLRFVAAGDSFLVHFVGESSKGKTALLQLVAALYGHGGNPNDGSSNTFVRRWNFTANALEGLAEAYSDLPLPLDEVDSKNVEDIRPLVYRISGGESKIVMNSTRDMQQSLDWRTIVVSSGEMSLYEKMSDPSGNKRGSRTVNDGLTHRALDLKVDDIVAKLPEEQRKGFVDSIKVNCSRYYGTAGPEFISQIIKRFVTFDKASAYVDEKVTEFLSDILPSKISAKNARALQRFALIGVAGELAVEIGVLPQHANVRETVRHIAVDWLEWIDTQKAQDPQEQILSSLRSFLIEKHTQCANVHAKQSRSKCVGWRDTQNDRWLFTEEQLRQAVPGPNLTEIVKALRDRELLFSNDSTRAKAKVSIGSLGKRIGVYAIKGSILGDDVISDEAMGQTGQPGQPGPEQAPQDADPVQEAA
jgi:putative DNA primase/helicase